MRISKKKFVYLISPNNLYPQFYQDLKKILETGKVGLFQLRLKKYSFKQKILIGKKIQQICKKNGIKFIVNDDVSLAKELDCDGCHLGQRDMNILEARKILKNKIIGITCHNAADTISRCVESALSQKYPNFDIIIVNGNSIHIFIVSNCNSQYLHN